MSPTVGDPLFQLLLWLPIGDGRRCISFPGVDLNSLVYLKQIDQVIDLDDPPFFLATSLLWNFEHALLCLSHLRSLVSVLLSFKVVLNCISFFKEFVHRLVQIFHFFLCSNILILLLYYFNYHCVRPFYN